MKFNYGIFTISLDFELFWGMRDKLTIEQYKDNLIGVRNAVPAMLKAFEGNNVHATWAVVGFLYYANSKELIKNLPAQTPSYCVKDLSPYKYINESINLDPVYHFAPELIEQIAQVHGQEIGTHTYSHYYCLEDGQSLEEFKEDIHYAISIAKQNNISTKSIVFPRNQWNTKYLQSLVDMGLLCFRGNEASWIYKASGDEDQNKFRRAVRLADSYLNISGYNTYNVSSCAETKPYNFPSSRFLRPYSKKLALLEGLRLRRIKKAMTHAAVNNEVYHLWWHPHNFGVNTRENISFLEKILEHYNALRNNYDMRSLNMVEICQLIEANNG